MEAAMKKKAKERPMSANAERASAQQFSKRLESHKPCCVVVVDRSGARFFRYWPGKLAEVDATRFRMNVEAWKRKDEGQAGHLGFKKTRGSQRDVYEHRMGAHTLQQLKQVAARATQICRAEGLASIFLVGSDRLTEPVRDAFAQPLRRRTALIQKDFGNFPAPSLCRRLAGMISELTAMNLQGKEARA